MEGAYVGFSPITPDWCYEDNCPGSICGGPHGEHTCPNGSVVILRPDQFPCLLCGYQPNH